MAETIFKGYNLSFQPHALINNDSNQTELLKNLGIKVEDESWSTTTNLESVSQPMTVMSDIMPMEEENSLDDLSIGHLDHLEIRTAADGSFLPSTATATLDDGSVRTVILYPQDGKLTWAVQFEPLQSAEKVAQEANQNLAAQIDKLISRNESIVKKLEKLKPQPLRKRKKEEIDVSKLNDKRTNRSRRLCEQSSKNIPYKQRNNLRKKRCRVVGKPKKNDIVQINREPDRRKPAENPPRKSWEDFIINSIPASDKNQKNLGSVVAPFYKIFTAKQPLSQVQLMKTVPIDKPEDSNEASQRLTEKEPEIPIIEKLTLPTRTNKCSEGQKKDSSVPDSTPTNASTTVKISRTRSGRLSLPPKYIVKDYKRIETESKNPETVVTDYVNVETCEIAKSTPKPAVPVNQYLSVRRRVTPKINPEFQCKTCHKIYLGRKRMTEHLLRYPDHKNDQTKKTNEKPDPRMRKRSFKRKLMMLMKSMDRMSYGQVFAKAFTIWEFALLKSAVAGKTGSGQVTALLHEFEGLLEKLGSVLEELLVPVYDNEDGESGNYIHIEKHQTAYALGMTEGSYKVNSDHFYLLSLPESNIPVNTKEQEKKKRTCSNVTESNSELLSDFLSDTLPTDSNEDLWKETPEQNRVWKQIGKSEQLEDGEENKEKRPELLSDWIENEPKNVWEKEKNENEVEVSYMPGSRISRLTSTPETASVLLSPPLRRNSMCSFPVAQDHQEELLGLDFHEFFVDLIPEESKPRPKPGSFESIINETLFTNSSGPPPSMPDALDEVDNLDFLHQD